MDKTSCPQDAWGSVDPFVYIRNKSPGEITEDVKMAARFLIEWDLRGFNLEQFCMAVCCDLELETQRQTAWFLVSDMLNGEFSWITPLKSFSVEKALVRAELIPENYFGSEKNREKAFKMGRFCFDSSELMKKIVEKFDLPTSRLRPNKILTEKENEERRLFNACYRGLCFRDSVL